MFIKTLMYFKSRTASLKNIENWVIFSPSSIFVCEIKLLQSYRYLFWSDKDRKGYGYHSTLRHEYRYDSYYFLPTAAHEPSTSNTTPALQKMFKTVISFATREFHVIRLFSPQTVSQAYSVVVIINRALVPLFHPSVSVSILVLIK